MKAKIKLAIGVTFAALALMAVSQTVNIDQQTGKENNNSPCYTDAEVRLVMKSNHWTRQETETILDLACQFSRRH
jgi:hypothetical protein